jgi:Subtilase family
MALRPVCSWIAVAFGVLLAGFEPGAAQAASVPGFERLDAEQSAVLAAFRLRGGSGIGRFRGAPRGSGVHPKGPSRHIPDRRQKGGDRTGTSGAAGNRLSNTDSAPTNPRHPSGDAASGVAGVTVPGAGGSPSRLGGGNTGAGGVTGTGDWPPRHPPEGGGIGAVLVPIIPIGGATFTIIGSGGAPRPPIAPPPYTETAGQNPAQLAAALLDSKRHRPRELLAEVGQETSESVKQELAREYGAEIVEVGFAELTGVRIWHFTLRPGRELRQTLIALLQDRRVMSVQPNYVYTPVQGAPQDGEPASGHGGAQASPPAEGQPPSGAGVKLAIIDTCVEDNHDELKGSVASSFSALDQVSSRCQAEDHGTAVASLIAGHAKLRGTAEGASILSAQAFKFSAEDNEVDATTREIWLSLVWAAKSGAQVMNLSFAGPPDPEIERAVAAAYRKGITLIAAAGNAGPSSPPLYPAAYPEVIAVTATDGRQGIYSAANRGKYISVSARGVDVLAAHINNTYGMESGTSFAAAEVSGIVASILEKRPDAGPDEVRKALQNTAAAVPGADKDAAGFGEVDPRAAVAFAEASPK